MSIRRSPGGPDRGRTLGWRLFQLLTLAALVWAGWRLLGHIPYRIDIDVYRMGGQAWLDGRPLYADGVMFHTRGGLDLPFTYPPLAAVVFSPFALLSLDAASIAITLTTLILLIVATTILLTRLDVWPDPPVGKGKSKGPVTGEPAWLPGVAGGGDRGAGGDLLRADPVELRLRPDQRRVDDAGHRRLRAA
jgi:alpha-1,2-mannosyltransferase